MKIHFIGIGGIGVSALAQYYLAKGHKVNGSDLTASEITESLRKKGAKLHIGKHKSSNLSKNVDLVIYSPAVKPNNPEFKAAKKLKLWIQSYPEVLGELTRKYFTIAVSGTHGKSTTSAMLGLLLVKAGFDPTVIVGTQLKEFNNSNCRIAVQKENSWHKRRKSKYLVIEADEHLASFLNYWPRIIVLTNIEADHLDYYKNLNNIIKAFRKYINHLPKDGWLVVNKDDKNIKKIIQKTTNNNFSAVDRNILSFSLKQKETKKLKKILKIPGEHNIANALAALTAARALKIPDRISFRALSEYRGSWRRFEIKEFKTPDAKRKIKLISDYAHHPTEVKASLKAVREKYPKKKIWCVFQPHQYQRTYYLFNDFVKVLRQVKDEFFADKLLVTDIYDVAGREEKTLKKKISSEKLIKKINKNGVVYLPKAKILAYLKNNLRGGEVLIIMGAGDIYQIAVHLTAKREKKRIN